MEGMEGPEEGSSEELIEVWSEGSPLSEADLVRTVFNERGGIGERDGAIEHLFPSLEFIVKVVFVLDITEGVEQKVADVSEDGGVAGRDAVLGKGGEEFAEDEVDVGGGQEVAGERSGKLGAEALGFKELLFLTGVEKAESGMQGIKTKPEM